MKKTYISPSITVVQIETENAILAGSGFSINGMNRLPSDPGVSSTYSRDRFSSYDEDELF